MAPEYDRKLIAVLYADAVGYSRLMGADEDATVETLKSYRGLIANLIDKHQGYLVDSPGDSLLAAFPSVLAAVRCAVETQEELKARNAELPEDRQMHFRIGVNQGDVIADGDRLYGDGVNVAARVEGLADPGGVAITGSAYEQVRKKLSLGYEDIGRHEVKNIEEPVQVYKVITEPDTGTDAPARKRSGALRKVAVAAVLVAVVVAAGVWFTTKEPAPPRLTEVASVENMAYPLPENPSIAVLPFDNLSGNPEDQYLADGLTENVITHLSTHPMLFVVSRNSTAVYKGQSVEMKKVAEALGVRYVLEGSVQISNDRIRTTIQLIDALTGFHRLSRKYDRPIDDLFALQDDISMEILKELQMQLVYPSPLKTNNLEAYRYATQGYYGYGAGLSVDEVIELARRAIDLDPDFVAAWAMLCGGYAIKHNHRASWGITSDEYLEKARDAANRALALDKENVYAIGSLAVVRQLERNIPEATSLARSMVQKYPSNIEGHRILADMLLARGNYEEAVLHYRTAIRLDPIARSQYVRLRPIITAYALAGEFTRALETYEDYTEQVKRSGVDDSQPPYLQMAALHVWMGQPDEAKAYVDKALQMNPQATTDTVRPYLSLWNPDQRERYLSALKEAGLK